MSWDRPDQEPGTVELKPNSKPFCTTRPAPYAPLEEGDKMLVEYMKERGLRVKTAIRNHWYVSQDAGDFYTRVVIPCTSGTLGNRYWQARLITDTRNSPATDSEGNSIAPRYQSPHGCQRGDALAIVHPKGNPNGTALVEGPFDALAAADIGYLGIGWMGKAPGESPIQLAQRMVVEPIYVIADKDAVAAAINIWKHFPGSFLVDPYPHKDLASMNEEERKVLLGRW